MVIVTTVDRARLAGDALQGGDIVVTSPEEAVRETRGAARLAEGVAVADVSWTVIREVATRP